MLSGFSANVLLILLCYAYAIEPILTSERDGLNEFEIIRKVRDQVREARSKHRSTVGVWLQRSQI